MAKRTAEKQLTDQNWEQEDESEDPGVFKPAGKDIIKGREIKKAKRRFVGQGGGAPGEETASAFKGFGGFTGLTGKADTTAKPSIAFGALANKPFSSLSNGGSGSSLGEAKTDKLSAFSASATPFASAFGGTKPAEKNEVEDGKTVSNGTKDSSKAGYLSQLRCLNESVSRWIKDHVDANPICILTPIFKDYEKHLAEIEKKNPDGADKTPVASKISSDGSVTSSGGFKISSGSKSSSPEKGSAPVFKFGSSAAAPTSTAGSGFSFKTTDTSTSSGLTGFSFKSATSDSTTTSGFSFKSDVGGASSGSGFSFATAKSENQSGNKAAGGEDDEYVPPKPESTKKKKVPTATLR